MRLSLPSAAGAAAFAFALAASGLVAPGRPAAAPAAPPAACAPDGGLSFVCGAKSPEDVVAVPGTRWLISSGMVDDGVNGGLHLIDSRAKTASALTPGAPKPDPRYPACPGPAAAHFVAHGLTIGAGTGGRLRLYVVTHGAREAVEAFDLDPRGARPTLTWAGCVRLPEGLAGNSVAALPDGRLLATVLFRKGVNPQDSFAGKPTGTITVWRPGQARFVPVVGSELAANNGIEVSADGRTVWVAASGAKQVVEFATADLSKPLRRAQLSQFAPDNVRLSPDGMLLAAGMVDDEPACGGAPKFANGKLDFSCHRGFMVVRIDPKTMTGTVLVKGARNPSFSGVTTALHVGGELWIASLMGDRLAYRPLP